MQSRHEQNEDHGAGEYIDSGATVIANVAPLCTTEDTTGMTENYNQSGALLDFLQFPEAADMQLPVDEPPMAPVSRTFYAII